ncbi:helix-turn-helix transcriptional regulator [Caulobacter sp. BE254]|uniref:helix-turn-helix transcriptional regulator n=1 Tax=Caulobacter sp. BE254 TaxID=2817720 RepID=UPI0028674E7D|nr:helix-turn-helix transcriptional regulator [Caulobacter sp. BE254]MDR7115630.1 transcriptional regulator with XRE-family HTH domain [Caulobacter sp. BE254]
MRHIATSTAENPLVPIAARLARVRAGSGLNQGQFAERLGFPKRTYLGWERAETEPPIGMLSAVRREFGIDPDWILHGPGDIPRRHASEIDWERLQRLQEEIRRYAYQIGLEPNGAQLLDLARAVFDEAPEVEEAALSKMKQTLKALAKGKV